MLVKGERLQAALREIIIRSPVTENDYSTLQTQLQIALKQMGSNMIPEELQLFGRQLIIALSPMQMAAKVMEEIASLEERDEPSLTIKNYARLARLQSQMDLGLSRDDFEEYSKDGMLFLAAIGKGKYVRIHGSLGADTGVGDISQHNNWLDEEKKKEGSLIIALARSFRVNNRRPTESALEIVPFMKVTENTTEFIEPSLYVRYTHLAHRMIMPARRRRLPIIFLP